MGRGERRPKGEAEGRCLPPERSRRPGLRQQPRPRWERWRARDGRQEEGGTGTEPVFEGDGQAGAPRGGTAARPPVWRLGVIERK